MVTVPKVCRAAVVRNPGENYTIETIEDFPVPTPGPGQLLLKLNVTGLCMSDHHFMLGDWGVPMAPETKTSGHEGAGVVAALGPGVDPNVWKVGDRAGLKPFWDCCHECDLCRSNREQHCDEAKMTGAAVNGSYAEYVISPARYTSRIPDNVPDEIAGPIMCSGSTMYGALKAGNVQAGQWVVVPGGGGGVGGMALSFGKALGARIVAVDTGDEKREMCRKLGAEAFVDFKTSPDVTAEVKKITGGGAHVVIVTGGTASAYKTAPSFLRKGGTQVSIGLPPVGTAIAGMDPLEMVLNKITILGSLVGSQVQVKEALDLANRDLIHPNITVLPFKEFPRGLDMLVKSQVAGRIVIDFNK
ncbi:putative alcohol dehydrogenase [Meredithblackwellia eburnea MCA 4105]